MRFYLSGVLDTELAGVHLTCMSSSFVTDQKPGSGAEWEPKAKWGVSMG